MNEKNNFISKSVNIPEHLVNPYSEKGKIEGCHVGAHFLTQGCLKQFLEKSRRILSASHSEMQA